MRLAVLLTAFIAVFTTQTDAVRVQFPQGASSTTIKGTLSTDSKARYVLQASSGQRLKVALSALGADYRFFVYAPKSDEPLNGMGMAFEWNGILPVTGDYLIQVFTDSRDRSVPFQLEIALTSAPATAHRTREETDFSPDGYYVLNGNAPKGFATFKGFSLTTTESRPDGKVIPVTPNGTIDAGRTYKMVNINVSSGSLSFESRPISGTSYEFEGKFLVTRGYCDDGRTTGPVLSGHLIRLLNGAKVAEVEVKFEWSCSDI